MNEKILLVDDDKSYVNVISSLLRNEGYIVEHSLTGEQALKMLQESTFDLIILDYLLPDLSGEKIIGKIREKDREIKIILVTGHPEYPKCLDTLRLGISDILVKPISAHELLNSISDALVSAVYYHNNLESWIARKQWIY